MENYIIEFYIEQYRQNAQNSKKRNINTSHYMHKINSKAKSIARASYKKTESAALNTLHSDIKRLAYLVYYTNNKNAKEVFATEIIPNLVRIDMSLFDEEEILTITPDF